MAIWQDLVDQSGFCGAYESVKRYVRKLRGTPPAAASRSPPTTVMTAHHAHAQNVLVQPAEDPRSNRMSLLWSRATNYAVYAIYAVVPVRAPAVGRTPRPKNP